MFQIVIPAILTIYSSLFPVDQSVRKYDYILYKLVLKKIGPMLI